MNTSKTIRGAVNSCGFTITPPITQWDYGYMFLPEIEGLPATYRLDFSNEEHSGSALPVYGGENGAEVPEELIDTGRDIFVWYFFVGDGYGKSAYKWRILNRCKPKTSEDEPTPSQQSSIDQLIMRSNEAVETAEQKAGEAGESALSAKDDADRAERARDDAQTYANNAQTSASQASASATASAESAEQAAQSEQSANTSANNASRDADRAEQAANNAGFMDVDIVNGRLIYTRTDAVDADFSLSNGRLIMRAI